MDVTTQSAGVVRVTGRDPWVPEGHTLHRLAHEHTRLLGGKMIAATSPQGRFGVGAARIDGRVVQTVEARGKHLLYRFVGVSDCLHVHLGLYGKFHGGACPAPAVSGALRLRLMTDDVWLDLRGPSACELLPPDAVYRLAARLGPDPLRADAEPMLAYQRIKRSSTPLGALLLDQSVLSGVGNIYRAEILFRHGISPNRPGVELDEEAWHAIWKDLARLMSSGVRSGRIVATIPDHRDRARGIPSPADCFYVYKRAGLPCRVCRSTIATATLADRTIYWCPRCQPS